MQTTVLGVHLKSKFLLSVLLMTFLLGMGGKSWGQIAQLELGTTSFSANTTGAATFTSKDANLASLPATSLTSGQQGQAGGTGYISSSTWSTAATVDQSKYYQFTLTASSGYSIAVTSVSFRLYRSGTGPASIQLSSDADNYASALGTLTLPATTNTTFTSSGLTITGKSSVTFRLYGYNASGTGTLRIGDGAASSPDIIVNGSVTSTSTPTISLNPSSASTFTYQTGSGPSTAQNFTVSAANLTSASGTINLSGLTNYEVSTNGGTSYNNSGSISYSSNGSSLTPSSISVRLKAGLGVNTYNETLAFNGGGATTNLALSGSVTAVPNYFWNGSTTSGTGPSVGGAGTWNTTLTNWITPTNDGSGTSVAWPNNATNIANFNGTGGVVTLGVTPLTPAQTNFNVTGYTILSGSSSVLQGPIALANNVNLQLPVDNTTSTATTLGLTGNITGGTGSSLTIRANGTSSTIASRINLTTTNETVTVPTVNISAGSGVSSPLAGFVGTATGTSVSSNIINNTGVASTGAITMLGATSNNSLTYSGVISGTSNMQFSAGGSGGAGVLTLTGNNTFTGNTYFNAATGGILKLGTTNSLPVTTNLAMAFSSSNGGVLDLNGFNQTVRNLLTPGAGGGSINNSSSTASILTVAQDTATTQTFSLPITNTNANGLALVKTGAATLILSGINTYTGGTTITAGTLQAGATTMLAATGAIVMNGGTLATGGFSLGTSGAPLGTLTLNNNSTIALTSATHSIYFAASNGVSWTNGTTLTITGWSGTIGSSASTGGKIVIGGTGGLTAAQLSQIKFLIGGTNYPAAQLSGGEVIPINPVTSVLQGATTYASGSTYTFSNTTTGTNNDITFTLKNTGIGTLAVSSIAVANTGTAVFSLQGAAPTSIAAGSSATFVIRFAPVSGVAYSGSFSVNSNSPTNGTYTVNLSGTGMNSVITTGTIGGSPFCVSGTTGAAVSVPFTSTGLFNSGNTYTAQLSDAAGSFASPVNLANPITSTANSGTITTTIPAGTAAGTGYRIRVVSSNPVVTGSDNGANLTIDQIPNAPTVNVTQPTCSVGTGTIVVTAPAGTGVTYSIDGTNYQASATFNNVAAATTYSVTAKNSSGCISLVTTATVNAQPATPAAPTVSITQPTCSVATATITVTAPTGTGITYSIDGTNYQASATFNNVTAGVTYNVTAQSSAGCVSSVITATVNAQPATPAAPTVSITQPTCAVATGTITITAPTGTGITYSIDGTNYQASATFSNVTGGTTYNVTAQSSAGCVSSVTTATVNSQPPTPAAPTVSIIQPTCAVATGTITVTAPTGTGLTYSIGSTYQASNTFNNVTAGTTYNVTVQNSAGCISSITTAIVNAQPATPAAPTLSITQPTCSIATATITVTAPTGTGITYSIDGTNYQASATFNNVTANATYNVTAQNSAGCISAITTAVVNSQPTTPAAPTVNVTQPTCAIATGTIEVTAPTGTDITYSVDGTNYQGGTTFNGLIPGSYNVTTKNSTGCISSATPVTIIAQPGTPAAPAVTITQPTCTVATGTITVTAPTGAGLTYSIDGTNYQVSTTFNNVAAGTTYNVTVQNSSGCTSTATSAIVNAQPPTPAAPTVSITQPTCSVATGTITVTAPTGTGITYSIDGTNYQSGTTFNNVTAGTTYNVTAQSSAGCISAITTATVNAQPPTPAAPAISITQPTCATATGTITVTAPTGTGITYSIDGTNYQASTTFNNVTAGTTYNVTVQNSAGCISSITTATVNAQPATPAAPTVSITQPTCAVATGTITITAPTGTGITYSIDGTNYQASTTFNNVTAGTTYNVTAQNNSGCISTITTATVNAQPPSPVITSQPSITAQNVCQNATANTLSVAATGTGLTYQWYSNTTQSNSGGTSLGTAGNNSSYAPSTAATGTLYYYVVITSSSSCSTTSNASGGVTVNPYATITLSSAPGTDNQSVIQGNTITNITYTVASGTGAQLTAGSFPTGVTGAYNAGIYTISGTPSIGGTFNYTITTTSTSGCNNSINGSILVCAIPSQDTGITFPTVASTSLATSWTAGNGTGRVVIVNTTNSFTNPTNSATLPTANNVYSGTGQQVVYNSTGNSVTVTGLVAATTYWFRVYEYNFCSNTYVYDTAIAAHNPNSQKTSAPLLVQSNFTSVLTPQFMGSGSSNSRIPMIYRATISGLKANAKYRYYTQAALDTAIGKSGGSGIAGNPLLVHASGPSYIYTSSPSLSSANQYDSLTTDASGNYTGWFGVVSTTNSVFNANNPGRSLYPTITIGDSTGNILYRRALDVSVKPLKPATTTTDSTASFFQSKTSATPKNLVALFDNTSASGRPIAITAVEYIAETGSFTTTSRPSGYDSSNGAWNAYIPNNNALGIRAIEQLSVSTGSPVGCTATDVDGQWATNRIDTRNPTNGLTVKVISGVDDPLATCPVYPTAAVQQGTTSYASNSTYTYANTVAGSNTDVTFTINNTGSGPLTISSLSVTNTGAAVFSLQGTAPATVAAGSSATFVVRFAPNSATTFTGKITINTNDTALASNPYIVNLSGTGIVIPVISVKQDATTYPNNTTYTYPNTVVGANNDVTFTITNTGGATLNISSINVTNAGATVYTLQGTAPTMVASNSSATFVVRFAPNSGNTFTGSIVINSDDPSQGTYTINLSGIGTNTVITTGTISGSPFCVSASAGAAVSVPFTYTPVDAYTTFTAQLSDGSGSFASATAIGNIASDGTGSQAISATIPAGTIAGNNYRIRVVSTSPAVTGSISSSVLAVSNPVTPSVSIARSPSTATICSGSPVTFTATPTNGGSTPTYQWYDGGVLVSGVTGNTYTLNNPVNGEQVYAVLTTSVTCYTTPTATSNTLTLTVSNPIIITLTSGTGSDAQTVTQGVAINDITYTVSGGPTTVTLSGTLPTGVTGSYNGGVYTITGTPTQTGTFNYTISATGGCNNNPMVTGSITVTTARIILADNGMQPGIKNVTTGSTNNILSTFTITNNLAASTTLTQVKTPLTSNYKAADIANFKLYSNTVNNLTSATVLSTQSSVSTGTGETVTFSSLSQSLAANATYYYWLTADIAGTAQTSDSIIASVNTASNFIFTGSPAITGSVSKAGAQIIASGAVAPGLLTVLRIGDGTSTVSAAALPVNVYQYNTSGTGQNGTLLKTLPTTPTTGVVNRALTQSATATSEGALNLSVNGRLLTMVGYNASSGTTNVVGGNADVVVGKMDAYTNINTVTSLNRASTYAANNIRSAITVDGKSYWTSGPATTGGIRYVLDSTSSGTGTQISALNSRVLNIANGQLYVSTGTTTAPGGGIYTVGSGLPTTSATTTLLPTASTPNPYSFVFLNTDPSSSTPNLLYVTGLNTTKTDNGIFKYYFDGTSWVAKGSNNLGSTSGKATSAFGIAGTIDASGNVVLYVTTSGPDTANSKADRLNKYFDNSVASGTLNLSTGTELAYSTPKYTFGGVAFTPTANGDTVIATSGVQLTGIYRNITVANGGSATLTGNVQILGSVNIRGGGTLDCGAYTISPYSTDFRTYFNIDSAGTLITSNPAGISTTGAIGSIQTSVFTNGVTGLNSQRNFSSGANYIYTAPIAQNTGIALPAVLNGNLTINADNSVQFSNTKQTINGTLTLTSGALILPATDTLTLGGAVTHISGSITANATSNLILNGLAAKALSFTSTGNTIHNLTINSTATAVSLDNSLNITSGTNYGTVICNGALNTNGYLTLKSDEQGTAAVGQSAGIITGNATVERFTNGSLSQGQSRRAWRFITSPVINGQSIHQAWQENSNNNTSYGTLITGYNMPDSTTAAAQGYDFTGAGLSTSIKRYLSASSAWVPLSYDGSTTGTLIPVRSEQAYMLFVRGDRTVGITGSSIATLRATGSLLQGNQTVTLSTGSKTVVGNPYASSIDFSSIYNHNSGAIQNQFYLWNSKLGTYGAYVLIRQNPDNSGNYQEVPSALAGFPTQNDDTYRYIPSGAGFFVIPATNPTPNSITISETDKTPGNNPTMNPLRVVAPNNVRQLRVNLNQRNGDTLAVLADGFMALFSDEYQGNERDNSTIKASNFYENLGLVKGNDSLIVEAREDVKSTDTVFMKLWNVTKRTYQFQVKADNFTSNPNIHAWMEDNYLKTKQELYLDGNITSVNFEVTKDDSSASPDRFRIIFGNSTTTLPVTLTSVKAAAQNNGVNVSWTVTNEQNIKAYTVERSVNGGTRYTAIGSQAAKNTTGAAITSYQSFDAAPQTGDNLYRIRIEANDGVITYSSVIKVTIGQDGQKVQIALYPNPVRSRVGKVNLQLTNLAPNTYLVNVYSAAGQTVYQKKVTVAQPGITQTEELHLNTSLAQGSYRLSITDDKGRIVYTNSILIGR